MKVRHHISKPISRKSISLIAGLLAAVSLQANAARDGFIDYARVVDAEPIFQTVEYDTPSKRCWTETVAYEKRGSNSATGTIVGGIIGAAIGNELGHKKSNKRVGAVAGAVLGASIGNDISKKNGHSRTAYRDQEHCEVTHHIRKKEELVGYRVEYKYHGQSYFTRTSEHPGKKIKIAVNVRPVE